MPNLSSVLDAAIRAIQGEFDMDGARTALCNWRWARVLALASDTHPMMRAIAALCGDLTALLDARMIADPALHIAIARMIGTLEGWYALWGWTKIAPTGWGRMHADAIIVAVQQRMCHPSDAAALIGPCDTTAALLSTAGDAAFAIRRWGQLTPDDPTGWMESLSVGMTDRLINAVQSDPRIVASCLPWLPPDRVHRAQIDAISLVPAMDAFAEASPTVRTQYAALVQRIIAQAQPEHLGALTRLACAMESEEIWDRVLAFVRISPIAARDVVVAAPWNSIPDVVRDIIVDLHPVIGGARGRLRSVDLHPVIDAARGHPRSAENTWSAADAFFASLDPNVWDALDRHTQRRWLRYLRSREAHLAVRSLGLRPEILARAQLHDDLITSARCHASDATVLRQALLPIALRDISPDAAHALISILSPPPNPGAFFCTASGYGDANVLDPASAFLSEPSNLAIAVVLQRSAERSESIDARCIALRRALRGQSWKDIMTIVALLDDAAIAALMPDSDDLINRLAHPNRHEAMRQALKRLEALPLDVSIPVRFALHQWAQRSTSAFESKHARNTAKAIACALRKHGDLFLSIVDALEHVDLRAALLPLPEHSVLSEALRRFTHDDPPTAQRLAHALQTKDWGAALHALLAAPPRHAAAIWRSLSVLDRCSMSATLSTDEQRVLCDPFVEIALAAIQCDDAALRNKGIAVLSEYSASVRAIWTQLPQALQKTLCVLPVFADLSFAKAHHRAWFPFRQQAR